MMTAAPIRQIAAPDTSQRSGRTPSMTHNHTSELRDVNAAIGRAPAPSRGRVDECQEIGKNRKRDQAGYEPEG